MKKSGFLLLLLIALSFVIGCGMGTTVERLDKDPGSIVIFETDMNFELAYEKVRDSYGGLIEGNVFNESGKATLRNDSQLRPYGLLFQVPFLRLDKEKTRVIIHAYPTWHKWSLYQVTLLNGKVIEAFEADTSWYDKKQ